MKENIFQSFWTVIPTVIFEDERVPLRAKKLYGLISSLTQKEGFCWASNNYLAQKSRIPVGSVRRYLRLLKKLGYIECELNEDGNERKIWLKTPLGNLVENSVESLRGGCPRLRTNMDRGVSMVIREHGHQDIEENNNIVVEARTKLSEKLTTNKSKPFK